MELTIAILIIILRLVYEKCMEAYAKEEAKKITKYKR